jgi:hypothetical protein
MDLPLPRRHRKPRSGVAIQQLKALDCRVGFASPQ